MPSFIFIAGAPGSGKSTIAKALQEKLNTPLFEFCWIPEFRYTGTKEIPYVEEEAIAFENLCLVLKNYEKHDFKNVIVTDLEDKRILQLSEQFSENNYLLTSLLVTDEELLKSRVLDKSRSSEYREWEEALKINKCMQERALLPNEQRIDVTKKSVEEVVKEILLLLEEKK